MVFIEIYKKAIMYRLKIFEFYFKDCFQSVKTFNFITIFFLFVYDLTTPFVF